MGAGEIKNRYLVVFGAILIQLALGNLYAWSVYTPVLIKAGWTKLDTQIVFTVGLVTFALLMIFAGKKLKEWGPQKLTILGGTVLGAGYILAGILGASSFWNLTLSIGLLAGAGIGLAYVVPIAVAIRWFPDKKGLITGLTVAGFGFGALGWVKFADSWGHLIENMGLAGTFIAYGVIYAVLIFIGSRWMLFPPVDWRPEGWEEKSMTTVAKRPVKAVEFESHEMLKTKQFYLLNLTFAFSSGAGLMAIGLMKLYPVEALQINGVEAIKAGAIASTAMAVFFSLANGLGRIIWGWISDQMSRRLALVLMTLSQGIIVILFTYMAGHEYLLYLGATLIGFNYGGCFALFPAVTADFFGSKNVGQNYPYVFLAYGLGGVLGPILGGVLGDLGNFPLAFTICGGLVLLGAVMMWVVKAPEKKLPTVVRHKKLAFAE